MTEIARSVEGISALHRPHCGVFSTVGHHTHHKIFKNHPDLAEPEWENGYAKQEDPCHKVYAKIKHPEKEIHVYHQKPSDGELQGKFEEHLKSKYKIPSTYKFQHHHPKAPWYMVG